MKNKKWLKIVGIVVVCLFVVGVSKDLLIKTAVTVGAEQVVGTPVKIGSLRLGILSQSVRIKDFQMYNPEGFPEGVLVDIPEVSVEYNLAALVKGQLHLPLVVFDLKETVVVKNQDGVLNVDA